MDIKQFKAGSRHSKKDAETLREIYWMAGQIVSRLSELGFESLEELEAAQNDVERSEVEAQPVDSAKTAEIQSESEEEPELESSTEEAQEEQESADLEGNSLKAVDVTDETIVVANHIVLFNNRDAEGVLSDRKNGDGSIGEYFTEETEFDSDYTKTGRLVIDWEHGRGVDGLDDDDVLGYVDWSTAKKTQDGIWVKRILDRRNKYIQALEPLIMQGLIGSSSEPVQRGIRKAVDGHIKRWPLKRDSMTVCPMEPKMMKEFGKNHIAYIKSIADEHPIFDSLYKQFAGALGEDAADENPPEGSGGSLEVEIALAKAKAIQMMVS